MTKPVSYTCAQIERDLGRCDDFDPSYDPRKLKRQIEQHLLTVVERVTGINTDQLDLSLPIGELVEDEVEVAQILAATGQKARAEQDLSLLVQRGRLGDLLPPLPSAVRPDIDWRDAYLAHVSVCEQLQHDEAAFRAAGCKRKGHVLLPKGRLSLVDAQATQLKDQPGRQFPNFAENYPLRPHALTATTRSRRDEHDPPLDHRTQSVASQRAAHRRQTKGALVEQIKDGLQRYVAATQQTRAVTVLLPFLPEELVNAGVPRAAALLLVKHLGGTRVLQQPDRATPAAAIGRLFGGAAIENDDRDAWLLFPTSRDLRRIAAPVRPVSALIKRFADAAWGRAKRHGRTKFFKLPIKQVVITVAGKRPIRLPLTTDRHGETVVLARLIDAAVANRAQWSIELTVGNEQHGIATLPLQHSALMARRATMAAQDYTTLRGFLLWELPDLLATKLLGRRKAPTARRLQPLTAKTNPMPTYTLTEEMVRGLEPGKYRPYTAGAHVEPGDPDASHGLFIYRKKVEGSPPQVVSAKRLATWLLARDYGRLLRAVGRGEIAVTPDVSPQPKASENPMRRNPTGYFDPPMTDWDFYSDDIFPPDRSVPTNRRNPRRGRRVRRMSPEQRELLSRIGKRAYAIMREKGCDLGLAMRQAWAEARGAVTNPYDWEEEAEPTRWPQHSQWQQVAGAYPPAFAMPPVNRRNPKYDVRRVCQLAKQLKATRGLDHSTAMKLAWKQVKGGR